jgi:hypothetical protein
MTAPAIQTPPGNDPHTVLTVRGLILLSTSSAV